MMFSLTVSTNQEPNKITVLIKCNNNAILTL